jgi:hypothetical protein
MQVLPHRWYRATVTALGDVPVVSPEGDLGGWIIEEFPDGLGHVPVAYGEDGLLRVRVLPGPRHQVGGLHENSGMPESVGRSGAASTEEPQQFFCIVHQAPLRIRLRSRTSAYGLGRRTWAPPNGHGVDAVRRDGDEEQCDEAHQRSVS